MAEFQMELFETLLSIAAVLTAVLGVFWGFKRLGSDDQIEFRKDILAELKLNKERYDALDETHKLLLGEHAKLKTEFELLKKELHTKVQLFESAHSHLPIPMWLKDLDGKMLAINDSYVDVFLRPLGKKREDYIGYIDHDIWTDEIADQFYENDQWVLTHDKTWRGFEIVDTRDGNTKKFHIIKFVRKVNGISIGIGGLAIDIDQLGECE